MRVMVTYINATDNDTEFDDENAIFVPMVGDIVTRTVRARENPQAQRAGRYRVVSREIQYNQVGGSNPTGAEDLCVVYAKVEEIS